MIRRHTRLLLVFMAVSMAGCAAPSSGDSAATRDDVIAASQQFYTAVNAMFTGDVAPIEAIWSHAADVTYLPPTGERLHGWQAVDASLQEQAGMRLGGRIEPQDVQVIVLGPSIALVTTTEVGNNPNGRGGPMDVNIRATKVFRREDGEWHLMYLHADPLAGLAAEAPGGD